MVCTSVVFAAALSASPEPPRAHTPPTFATVKRFSIKTSRIEISHARHRWGMKDEPRREAGFIDWSEAEQGEARSVSEAATQWDGWDERDVARPADWSTAISCVSVGTRHGHVMAAGWY